MGRVRIYLYEPNNGILVYSWAVPIRVLWGRLLHMIIMKVNVAQSCQTLCDPVDYTVHGILQARILEWVAIPFSRGFSQPRDRTQVSCTASRLSAEPPGKPKMLEWVAYPFISGSFWPGSPALQADSSPAELPWKPNITIREMQMKWNEVSLHTVQNGHHQKFHTQ